MAGVLWCLMLSSAFGFWLILPGTMEQTRNTQVTPLNALEPATYTFWLKGLYTLAPSVMVVEFPRLTYSASALAGATCAYQGNPVPCVNNGTQVVLTMNSFTDNEEFRLDIFGVINPAVYPRGTGLFKVWSSGALGTFGVDVNVGLESVGLAPPVVPATCYQVVSVGTSEVQESTALSFTVTSLVDIPAGSNVQIKVPNEFTVQQGQLPCTIWGIQVNCVATGQLIEAMGTPSDISMLNSLTNFLNITVWGITNPSYALPPNALNFQVSIWDANVGFIYNKCTAKSGNITEGAVVVNNVTYPIDVVQPIYGGWSVVEITFRFTHPIPVGGYIYIRLNDPIYDEWYDTTPTSEIGGIPKTNIDYCCVRSGLELCQANCHRMNPTLEQYHYELLIDGTTVSLTPQNITLRVMLELWYEPVISSIQTRTSDHRVIDSTFLTQSLTIPQITSSAYTLDSFISRSNAYFSFNGVTPQSNSKYNTLKFSFTSTLALKVNTKFVVTLNMNPTYFSVTNPPVSCSGSLQGTTSTTDAGLCGLSGNKLYFLLPSGMTTGVNNVNWQFGPDFSIVTPLLPTGQCIFHIVHIDVFDDSGNAVFQTNYPMFLFPKLQSDLYRVVTPWIADSNSHLTQWTLKFKPTVKVPFQQGDGESLIRFTCDNSVNMVTAIKDINGVQVGLNKYVQGFQFSGYTDTRQVSIKLGSTTLDHPSTSKPSSGFSFTVTTPEILKTEVCYEVSVLANAPSGAAAEETVTCAAEYMYTIGCEPYRVEIHTSVSTTTLATGNTLSYRAAATSLSNSWTALALYHQTVTAVGSVGNITVSGTLISSQTSPALISCWLPNTWKFSSNSTLLLDGYRLGNVTWVNDWATVISGYTWGDASLNSGLSAYLTLTNVTLPQCSAGGSDPIVCYYGSYSKAASGYSLRPSTLSVSRFHNVLNALVGPTLGLQSQPDAAYSVTFQLGYGVSIPANITIRINSAFGDSGLFNTSQGACSVNVPANCSYSQYIFTIRLQAPVSPFQTINVTFSGLENPVLDRYRASCGFSVVSSIKVSENCVNSYSGQALNINTVCLRAPEPSGTIHITDVELFPANPDIVPSDVQITFNLDKALRPGSSINVTFPVNSIQFTQCFFTYDLTTTCKPSYLAPNVIELVNHDYMTNDILFISGLQTSSPLGPALVTMNATYKGGWFTSYTYYRTYGDVSSSPGTVTSYFNQPVGFEQQPISSDFRVTVWPTRTEGELVTMTFVFVPRVSLTSKSTVVIQFPVDYGAAITTDTFSRKCKSPTLGKIRCSVNLRSIWIRGISDVGFPPSVEQVIEIQQLRNPAYTGTSTGLFTFLVVDKDTHQLLDYDKFNVAGDFLFTGPPLAIWFNPDSVDTTGRLISPERSVNFTISASDLFVGHLSNYTFSFPADRDYNFSMVNRAAMIGVAFPQDYGLSSFVDAMMKLVPIPEPDQTFLAKELNQIPCELTIYKNDTVWAICILYENHVLLPNPPKGLHAIKVYSIRNPYVSGVTGAFTLKVYESYVNDYTFRLYDAGALSMNITYQTYPSLGDYTLDFVTNPKGFNDFSYNEVLVVSPENLQVTQGTLTPAVITTKSHLPNFDLNIEFKPIVLNSMNEITTDVYLQASSWNWLIYNLAFEFSVIVTPTASNDIYTVYWQYEENWWYDSEVFVSPNLYFADYSYYNNTSTYLPPQPMTITVLTSPVSIHSEQSLGILPRGTVRPRVKILVDVAPSTPLTLSFTTNVAGVTVAPESVVLAPGATETEITVSVAAAVTTSSSATIDISLSGDSASSYSTKSITFDIRDVLDSAYSLTSLSIAKKMKTSVTFALVSPVGGQLKWAVVARGSPAPQAVDITSDVEFSSTSSFRTHVMSSAMGIISLATSTTLTVANLRASTRYTLFCYVVDDYMTVGPLNQYSFETMAV